MTHRVVFTHEARRPPLDSALWWSRHRSPGQAAFWLDGFEAAIASLAQQPDRSAEARESLHFYDKLYQLLYGASNRPTHRAVYRIRGEVVEIVAIRHVAQRDLHPRDG